MAQKEESGFEEQKKERRTRGDEEVDAYAWLKHIWQRHDRWWLSGGHK
jgi:hypothetical protein